MDKPAILNRIRVILAEKQLSNKAQPSLSQLVEIAKNVLQVDAKDLIETTLQK